VNKKERKQFNQAWLEIENIITLIEPEFIPEKQFKRPEEAGPYELNLLLQFLRVAIKMELHDKESTHRENETLRRMVDQQISSSG